MTAELRAALAALRTTQAELTELPVTIRTMTLSPRIDRLPPVPRRRPREDDDDDGDVVSLPPTLTAQQVLEGWRRGREAWLGGLRRRDLSAVVAATAHPQVGEQLAVDDGFARALVPRLRPLQQRRAVNHLVQQRFPPAPALVAVARGLRDAAPDRVLAWWGGLADPASVAKALATAIAGHGWAAVRAGWQLSDAMCRASWAEAVVERATAQTLDELARLLVFADGGEPRPGAELRPPHRAVIQRMVALGTRSPPDRVTVAALLRRRVGDVFGAVDEVRWRGLEAERRTIRAWVASEVLDVLFKHLVPDTMGAHQTEARRRFWGQYTPRVDRLWLLVDPTLRRRLARDEVQQLLDKVGDLIEIRDLRGANEQAIVWMHLRSDIGAVVTVVEGNANTTCRVRPGAHDPPRRSTVDYSRDIVHGLDHVAGAIDQVHHGQWEARLGPDLARHGIRK